jgi:hypothetical protein
MKTHAILAAAFVAILAGAAPLHAMSGKPQLPVQITIGPAQPGMTAAKIKPGDITQIAVSARSMTAISEMKIEVSLHGGAELVSGPLEWAGPAGKGETKQLLLTVRAPQQGAGTVKATVTFVREGKQVLKRSMQYRLGAGDEEKNKKPAYQIKKDSKGRDIIEY